MYQTRWHGPWGSYCTEQGCRECAFLHASIRRQMILNSDLHKTVHWTVFRFVARFMKNTHTHEQASKQARWRERERDVHTTCIYHISYTDICIMHMRMHTHMWMHVHMHRHMHMHTCMHYVYIRIRVMRPALLITVVPLLMNDLCLRNDIGILGAVGSHT